MDDAYLHIDRMRGDYQRIVDMQINCKWRLAYLSPKVDYLSADLGSYLT